jgi:hypothetical protein
MWCLWRENDQSFEGRNRTLVELKALSFKLFFFGLLPQILVLRTFMFSYISSMLLARFSSYILHLYLGCAFVFFNQFAITYQKTIVHSYLITSISLNLLNIKISQWFTIEVSNSLPKKKKKLFHSGFAQNLPHNLQESLRFMCHTQNVQLMTQYEYITCVAQYSKAPVYSSFMLKNILISPAGVQSS